MEGTEGKVEDRSRHLLEHAHMFSVAQLCLTLCDCMECSTPGSSVHGFSRQEYWSGLPFPSPGDLPDPGIKPKSPHGRQILYHLSHQGSQKISIILMKRHPLMP